MQREYVEYLVMILYALTVRWSSRFGDQLRYFYRLYIAVERKLDFN